MPSIKMASGPVTFASVADKTLIPSFFNSPLYLAASALLLENLSPFQTMTTSKR